jgi:hypothetical protein
MIAIAIPTIFGLTVTNLIQVVLTMKDWYPTSQSVVEGLIRNELSACRLVTGLPTVAKLLSVGLLCPLSD